MMNIEKLIGKELHGQVIHNADDFGTLFLKYGKVAVVPGTSFGAPTFVRWSYATATENIRKGAISAGFINSAFSKSAKWAAKILNSWGVRPISGTRSMADFPSSRHRAASLR